MISPLEHACKECGCGILGQDSTSDNRLRILANTRRTLLKLVANIDEAIGTVDQRERQESLKP